MSTTRTTQEYLNALAGTTGLTKQQALARLAGITETATVNISANYYAGTSDRTAQEALNVKASANPVTTYTKQEAVSNISGVISTSYANPLGSGNRTASITVSSTITLFGPGSTLVDGVTSATTDNYYITDPSPSGKYVRFDFGTGKVINEIKHYQELTTSHTTFKWQGSPDASAWTDIGGTFTLGGSATQTITTVSANTTSYRYYQMICTANGTGMSGTPYVYEYEFKIN